MKNLNITLNFEDASQVENQTNSCFDWKDLYHPKRDITYGGQVYIIPEDSNSFIMPAHYNDELPKGSIMRAIILCNQYVLNGERYKFNRLIGINAYAVDNGGANNYHVAPIFRDNEPAVIPPIMVHELVEKYRNVS